MMSSLLDDNGNRGSHTQIVGFDGSGFVVVVVGCFDTGEQMDD